MIHRFARWFGLVCVLAAFTAVAAEGPVARPNILWLIAEDFSQHLGCYGTKEVWTPNLDRLAADGMRFTRAFTTAPVCSASRSAFITGMYQTAIGAHHHRPHRDDGFTLPPGVQVMTDRFRAAGYFTANLMQLPARCGFKGTGKTVLPEPQALLTEASRLPGLDGAKMSKSYNNSIAIREDKASLEQKVRRMPTDPARVKRSDPGDPQRCPVWDFHKVYSGPDVRQWVQQGCASAGIGCLECKQPVIDAMLAEQQPMLERAEPYITHPQRVREIVDAGTQRARKTAQATMQEVRAAMGLNY